MNKSSELYERERILRIETLAHIINELCLLEGKEYVFDMSWQDNARNEVYAISFDKGVHFGGEDYYPISDLGLDDALYILSSLEG